MEPAEPGGAQLARELRQAGQRRPHQHRVRHRLEPHGEEVRDRCHDVVVRALAAQLVVDVTRPVDAHQRPQQAASHPGELAGQRLVHVAVEEEARLRLVCAGDVVDERDEVVAQERVAADEHEARGAERDALVDGVPPLVRRQFFRVPQGVSVVAVTAGTSAPVGDVQVDLAQALQRLTAQQRAALETLEQRDIVRVVHVDPEGKLDEVETARPCRALRVGEQRRRAHWGRGEQADDSLRMPAPHGAVESHQVVAAVGGRTDDETPVTHPREGLLEILERDRRTVAVDHGDCLGAGVERVGEHGGESFAERLAALLKTLPAACPADERVGGAPPSGVIGTDRGPPRLSPA